MRTKQLRTLSAAVLVTAALGLAGCSAGTPTPVVTVGADGELDMDALVEAAQAEGDLTVYDNGSEPKVRTWTSAFTDEYGIPVTIVREGDAALFQKFAQEAAAGQYQADVISLLDRGGLDQAVENGWLAEYTPEGADALPADFSRPGYYHPVQGTIAQVIAYNTNNVTEEEEAQLRADPWGFLATPGLTNRVAVGEPASKDDLALWYAHTEGSAAEEYGWDAAAGIAANTGRIISGSTLIAQALVQGEFDFGFSVPDSYITTLIARDGAPLGFVYPEPTVMSTNATAISAGAPHPNAARLFVEWAASPEGVETWAEGADQEPIRSDVADPRPFLDEPWYSSRPDNLWEDPESDQEFLDAASPDGPFRAKWNEIFGYTG